MAKRVILGKRGNSMGLFISKPSIDVETALPGQMLMSTENGVFQIIGTGEIQVPKNGSAIVNIGQLGFIPWILYHYNPYSNGGQRYFVSYDFPTPTQLRFTSTNPVNVQAVRYSITNIPVA